MILIISIGDKAIVKLPRYHSQHTIVKDMFKLIEALWRMYASEN